MPCFRPATYDVVIAGAGPVGLFLACELRLGGCSVLVLERERDASSPLKALPFGLRGLSVPTIESFDRRGLLDALTDRAHHTGTAAAAHWQRQQRRPAGHFAGIQFFHDEIDDSRWSWRLPGAVASLAVDMAGIVAVLGDRASELGVEIRRGCGADGFEQEEDVVTVRAGGEAFRGRWLVGCDGARSIVRKSAGIDFVGTDPEFTGYSVQLGLADPDRLAPGRHHTATGTYTYTPPGTIAMVDFDGGAFHRTRPITREHVEAVLRRVSCTDVTVTALELATTWTDRACQATDYRRGRVLLAGDAAHVHSPLGGQGLNLGLGDAMNLGWKLATTIHGDAPDGLLDSYGQERRPVGAQILDWSRAQVALMRPGPGLHALGAIVRDLAATRDGATYFAERVLGVGLRYDIGDDHPLVGRSAPDFAFHDGSRLAAHQRDGRGLLIDFGRRPALRALACASGTRIRYLAGEARGRLGVEAMLIRPDGIVAWAEGSTAGEIDPALAVARWFGAGAMAAK